MGVSGGYIESVAEAGGMPLLLPLREKGGDEELLALCDGFLLTGSYADVDPDLYGKKLAEGCFNDPLRDALDARILRHADAMGKPVFGICRGCQMMNVWRGGSLAVDYTDLISDGVKHDGEKFDGPPAHRVQFTEGATLGREFGGEAAVNSVHHQVCERVGDGLRVAAYSEDGLIEAIEDAGQPDRYFAVQWHPERSPDGGEELSLTLFARFVRAAARYQEARIWRG